MKHHDKFFCVNKLDAENKNNVKYECEYMYAKEISWVFISTFPSKNTIMYLIPIKLESREEAILSYFILA